MSRSGSLAKFFVDVDIVCGSPPGPFLIPDGDFVEESRTSRAVSSV